MNYQEFPKLMMHPSSQPAVIGFGHAEGKPATFPPVTVNTPDQEAMYAAKGYMPMGGNDSAAFYAAKQGQPTHYRYQEYPKFIRVDGEDMIATSEAHEHELLGYNKVTEKSEPMVEAPVKRRGRPPKVAA